MSLSYDLADKQWVVCKLNVSLLFSIHITVS